MADPQDRSVEERLARLEAAVEEIRRSLEEGASPAAPIPPPRRAEPWIRFDFRLESQHWLNKVGIGLLLFGVAFLFQYSIDQGWLTEWVRVGLGLVLALVLLGAGVALYGRQRRFSQVLLGGGMATLYITGFAAYQLYGLVGYGPAFAYMLVVTAAAFVLSLRQDDAVLSLVATIGAFGTPFLLYTREGSLPGLVGYASLVIAGTAALYLYRGWRSILWTASAGGWAVLFFAHERESAAHEHAPLQAAVALAWLAFWALPLLREALRRHGDASSHGPLPRLLGWSEREATRVHIHLLSVTTPVTALALTRQLWSFSTETWGLWMVGAAALHAAVAGLLARRQPGLAATQVSAAGVLLTLGTIAVLDGEPRYLALAAQAVLLHLLARRLPGAALATQAHLLFAGLALWLGGRLADDPPALDPLWNGKALADLLVIALALAVSVVLRRHATMLVYRFAAHIAFLGWWWRELAALPNGEGYVTAVWGAYGVFLLFLGLRRDSRMLQTTALATLLLPVAKLFLVDLRTLAVPWRILLFLGFGGAFLLLSYYLQVRWRPTGERGAPE